MEHLVVSLETAKKLKAAGLPQESLAAWYMCEYEGIPVNDWKLIGSSLTINGQQVPWSSMEGVIYFAAPTAQEIADQLPEALTVVRHTGTWNAAVEGTGTQAVVAAEAETMAEALAALWLKLQETKS